MVALVERLQREARGAGAVLRGQVRVASVDPRVGELEIVGGERLMARWIVDASGGRGPRARQVPRSWWCAAAQRVYRCVDRDLALSFLGERGVSEGEVLSLSGLEGGYSILNVRVHGDEVSLLSGSLPGRGHASGPVMMDRFAEAHPWIGERLRGGDGPIPLAPPRARLHEGRVVYVGDAAGQVYALHGSGVGAGMVAARMAVEAIAEGRVEAYTARWQRTHGGALAASWLFMAFAAELTSEDVGRLIRAGLLAPERIVEGLGQASPGLPARALPGVMRGLAREPAVARRLLPVAARMSLAQGWHAVRPAGGGSLGWWHRGRDGLLGSWERSGPAVG